MNNMLVLLVYMNCFKMEKIIILLLFTAFISCKESTQITPDSNVSKIETVYCDSSSVMTTEKRSMYNLDYTSVIHQRPIKEKEIVTVNDSIINKCFHNEFELALIKKQDTVYNLTMTMQTFTEAFISFDKNLDRNELKELKLDSINVKFARTKTLYYNCYFTNYNKNKTYETSIGIDYSSNKGDVHLVNYFTEIPLKNIY